MAYKIDVTAHALYPAQESIYSTSSIKGTRHETTHCCSSFDINVCQVIAAQQVREGEAFYQAIRTNDLAALRSLVTQYDPNVKLSNGLTPLIVAASVGTRDAVTLLVQQVLT